MASQIGGDGEVTRGLLPHLHPRPGSRFLHPHSVELSPCRQIFDELKTQPVLPCAFDDHAEFIHWYLCCMNKIPASFIEGKDTISDPVAGYPVLCYKSGRCIEAGLRVADKIFTLRPLVKGADG